MALDNGGEFSVTRPALVSAGAAAETASGNVGKSAQLRLTGATPEVISTHPGWQSSATLRVCLDAWEIRFRQLANEIQQISQNLNDTVDGYDKAEAQTLANIQQAAAGLDGKAS
jgi:hypothetical protein